MLFVQVKWGTAGERAQEELLRPTALKPAVVLPGQWRLRMGHHSHLASLRIANTITQHFPLKEGKAQRGVFISYAA